MIMEGLEMHQGYNHGGGHHGRTHDAEKMVPLLPVRMKSKTRKYAIPQHGAIRPIIGKTAKKLAKLRHKKKSRNWHKRLCKEQCEIMEG
jgi:hypothetical protein